MLADEEPLRDDFLGALSTKATCKIYQFLSGHPEIDYSVSELARQTKISRLTTGKAVDRLIEVYLVETAKTYRQGNAKKVHRARHPFVDVLEAARILYRHGQVETSETPSPNHDRIKN
jgi:DNA-binding transcriptional regulator GbsR (MarR family)